MSEFAPVDSSCACMEPRYWSATHTTVLAEIALNCITGETA